MADGAIIPSSGPAIVQNPRTHELSLQELVVPGPGAQDHIIQVHAVALTHNELTWPEPLECNPPIPGYDVAGTVLTAAEGSPFKPGDEVYARTDFDRQGMARPFAPVAWAELAHKPRTLSWAEAATVPMSALTAWQALFVHGGIAAPGPDARPNNKDKKVLITAAAGGCGLWAVQLAHLAGVGHVVGTCGPANVEYVRGLGADEVLDYTQVTDLSTWDGGKAAFDLVLDGVGGETLEQAWTCAKDGGIVISLTLPADVKRPEKGVAQDVKSVWFIVEADRAQLERITELLDKGAVKTALDSTFEFRDYEKAFERLHGKHVRGKVVLTIAPAHA